MTAQRTDGPAPSQGAAMNAPVFALRKTWIDPRPGIAMVQIHYAWTPPGHEPDWANAEEAVLAPEAEVPSLRTAVLEVPRFVDGSANYSLHHFFFVVSDTERIASPVFTEDVVSHEVTYEDISGEFTFIGLAWSAVESSPALRVANYTSTAMDGLPFQSAGADASPEPNNVYEFVQAQPLPHIFRGLVWGIRDTQVRYVFHRIRNGSPNPGDDVENWADNGAGGWTVEL